MSKVLTLFIIGFAIWYWSQSQKAKSMAIQAAKRRCMEAGVQFLDHTVVQKGLALIHPKGGGIAIARQYVFEFTSTGEHRFQGAIQLRKGHIVSIELEPWNLN